MALIDVKGFANFLKGREGENFLEGFANFFIQPIPEKLFKCGKEMSFWLK